MTKKNPSLSREQKLAAKLKENLVRRKQQARSRRGGSAIVDPKPASLPEKKRP